MLIMSFDIASKTGVAFGRAGSIPRVTTVVLGKRGATNGQRFSRAIAMGNGLVHKHRPDLVVIEAPIGGKDRSEFLAGVAACVEGSALRLGVHVERVNIGSVRKHYLGKHYTARDFPALKPAASKLRIKGLVMQRARLLGVEISNDDEADAAAIFDYASARWGGVQSAPLGGLFT